MLVQGNLYHLGCRIIDQHRPLFFIGEFKQLLAQIVAERV